VVFYQRKVCESNVLCRRNFFEGRDCKFAKMRYEIESGHNAGKDGGVPRGMKDHVSEEAKENILFEWDAFWALGGFGSEPRCTFKDRTEFVMICEPWLAM